MKLLIASDIHGSAFWCRCLCDLIEMERPDRLILLGDLLYHGPRNDLPRDYAPKQVIPMLSQYRENIIAVRGNCEAEVDQMVLPFPCMAEFSQLLLDGKTFYLTHGHHHNPDDLPPLPEGSVFLSRAHPCEDGRSARRRPLPEPRQCLHPQGREPQLSDL